MAFEDFKKKISTDVNSPEHNGLLTRCRNLIDGSRSDMATYYGQWDHNDRIFRGKRHHDREDEKSKAKGQPAKLIVPLTYSQIMTFVSFGVMTLMQNKRFFELEPTNPQEARILDEVVELIIERDLRKNMWTTFLVQFLLDIGRFSCGAAEIAYQESYRYLRVPTTENVEGAFGVKTQMDSFEYQKIATFKGNRVFPVSPYRFFPDTRLPMVRYQEGEFCGSEDQFSLAALKSGGEDLFNLDKIPKWTELGYKARRKRSRIDIGPERANPNLGTGSSNDATHSTSDMVVDGPVVVTKGVFEIVPADFTISGKKPLGDQEFPIRYLVWYANDKRIVRFDEATFVHGMYPYICAQYLPDQGADINESIADMCDRITDLITWKLNAHVASQKRTVQSRFVIDPAGIDVRSLDNTQSPYILTKKNSALSGTSVDRYIKQFQTVDPTQSVMKDIAALKDLNESVTGLSGQMQGQYSQGRRSATQDRVVAQGASARSKTTLGGIWDAAFEPLGKMLIANNRQEMDKEEFFRIVGKRQWPKNELTQQSYTDDEVFTMFRSTPKDIALSESFFVFDGTLPSEKAFLAQSLQEMFLALVSNPALLQLLQYTPDQVKELFNQIYILRGVTPARLPQPTQASAPIVLPPPAGASGNPAPAAATGTS